MKKKEVKSLLIIYVDFQTILLSENNGKQNPEESYANKYQNLAACSYGYKSICFDYTFSKSFKTYLGKDAVHKFINSMIEKSKYCSIVVKKHFNQ